MNSLIDQIYHDAEIDIVHCSIAEFRAIGSVVVERGI